MGFKAYRENNFFKKYMEKYKKIIRKIRLN